MKKIILLFLVCILYAIPAAAKKTEQLPICPNAKTIDLVYINGADENLPSFQKIVRGVHDDMIEAFQSDPLMYKRLLKNGSKKIGEKEVIYFWGEETKQNIEALNRALEYTKKVSSVFAQFGRATLAHLLHDAIWVSKPANSKKLLDNLNALVKEEHNQGKQVILYGYSAGSLITYDYVSKRLPVFDLKKLSENPKFAKRSFTKMVNKYNFKPTCLEAMTQSEIMFYTSDGKLILNPNRKLLVKNFENIDKYTKDYCAPQDSVAGVVLFGTPLVTFDSDASIEGSLMNELSQYLLKYIIEHDVFLLSINYAQDFIGMPMTKKIDCSMLKESSVLEDTEANGGFIYDNSGIKYRVNTLAGHGAYWKNGKKFARAISDSYNQGYTYFYNIPQK